jgi:hypothetical protein
MGADSSVVLEAEAMNFFLFIQWICGADRMAGVSSVF